ncbi:putative disease resistance protein RGA1 [Lolium rigidum]|uniref:putative disease resistance protein RGA1 n=1 Tax=Lolium rigidum TaxID=89674 RepID=UPI001F5C75E1|nr:putative disease resistance protein RGA1 [Lolium rigidum]
MEAAKDTSPEASIAWLVQTILATLLMDKMEEWIRQVGFGDDIDMLKSEIRRVEIVADAVIGRAAENKTLARSLARVNELLYETDDVVDELDYCRLQQQIEGVTWDEPEGVYGAERVDDISIGDADTPVNSSVGKLRSVVWEHFTITEKDNGKPVKSVCRYCAKEFTCKTKNGTSSMNKHVNKICTKKPRAHPLVLSSTDATANATPTVIGDSSTRKRRRVDELAQTTACNTHNPWDKATLSNRIRKYTSQLQEIREEVSEALKLHGLDLASNSNHHRSISLDQQLRTSSLVPRKVYGRVAEKDSIIKMITDERYDGVVVLPIVGIAGVGKTTLAQLVYNDPDVEAQFDHRVWVCVSHNFDEVSLTREILDSISRERHGETNCFAKLQEILKNHANSKRLLLILDNVWDDKNDIQWGKMLVPLVSTHAKGNVILVTTRNMIVAKRLGTIKPVKLDALANDDFWLLFKSCAFGYENHEEHQSISIIGQKIAGKLKGNPLAAVSTGELLRKKLNIGYWTNILENDDWKSMQLSRGIMSALKLSYDQLPYHLQQCFSYCAIFPDSYQFLGEELVSFWIAQRFVKYNNSSQSLEGIGWSYLIDLVNLGFLQEVEREEPYLGSQALYAVCGIMHDFAMMVSRDDCASICGLQRNKMSQTLRHLSIVTGSSYNKDRHGEFEENLRNAITSVSKLRTLVLLGHYDSFFLQLFQEIFRKAHNVRVLQMSAASSDILKRGYDEVDGALPQVLSKLYHLQVLNVGSYTDPIIPDGIDNLVSLRHLVVHKGVYSAIATIDSMTSFDELHGFKFKISSGFEMTRSQTISQFVQDSVHQLDNVKNMKEVYEAVLKKNELLEKLHLSWKGSSTGIGVELLPMAMEECGSSSEPCMGTAGEVLGGLEPRRHIMTLQISGYSDATSPTGLDSNISVTSLLTIHLYGCGEWQMLPSFERFPNLKALVLSNLQKVIEILVPSLEELVLLEMPKLERCLCTSVEGMNSRLTALQIEECHSLKEFDLFENDDNSDSRRRSWLPCLRKLILRDCPELKVLKPLPPAVTVSVLRISGVSTLPSMKGSSSGQLHIGYIDEEEDGCNYTDESSDELRILDDKFLAFHNLINLKSMIIMGLRNLTYFSLKGFSHLVSLKSLEISTCEQLFSLDLMPQHTLEDMSAVNCRAFPCLESLSITSCGIAGKWLSLLLRHAPDLEELELLNLFSIEEGESSSTEQDDTLTGLAQDGLMHILPVNLISSLKKITIKWCPRLTFNWREEGFSGFTSLQELNVRGCPKLFSSSVHKGGNNDQADGRWILPTSLEDFEASLEESEISQDCSKRTTLQPCFPGDLTSLKKLCIQLNEGLENLQLHSCTALEELTIEACASLSVLEGLQSLGSLRHLALSFCHGLPPLLECFSSQGYELCSRLESLKIDDPSVLTNSFCERLTSLQCLTLGYMVLTEEQGRSLVLLKSLQLLEFFCWSDFQDLPAGLYLLPSLKWLRISYCQGITRLPESGLPHSLEELELKECTKELADQCSLLATNKLRVKIVDCTY